MLSVRMRRDEAVPDVLSEDEEGWAVPRAAFRGVSGASAVGDFWESLKGHQ